MLCAGKWWLISRSLIRTFKNEKIENISHFSGYFILWSLPSPIFYCQTFLVASDSYCQLLAQFFYYLFFHQTYFLVQGLWFFKTWLIRGYNLFGQPRLYCLLHWYVVGHLHFYHNYLHYCQPDYVILFGRFSSFLPGEVFRQRSIPWRTFRPDSFFSSYSGWNFRAFLFWMFLFSILSILIITVQLKSFKVNFYFLLYFFFLDRQEWFPNYASNVKRI